jgi:hypothetical protein
MILPMWLPIPLPMWLPIMSVSGPKNIADSAIS